MCLLGLSVGICACHSGEGVENPTFHCQLPYTVHLKHRPAHCGPALLPQQRGAGHQITHPLWPSSTRVHSVVSYTLLLPLESQLRDKILEVGIFSTTLKTPARIPIWVEVLIRLPIWKPRPVPGLYIIECMILPATQVLSSISTGFSGLANIGTIIYGRNRRGQPS